MKYAMAFFFSIFSASALAGSLSPAVICKMSALTPENKYLTSSVRFDLVGSISGGMGFATIYDGETIEVTAQTSDSDPNFIALKSKSDDSKKLLILIPADKDDHALLNFDEDFPNKPMKIDCQFQKGK